MPKQDNKKSLQRQTVSKIKQKKISLDQINKNYAVGLHPLKQLCSLYEKPKNSKQSFADILNSSSDKSTQSDIENAKKIFNEYLAGLERRSALVTKGEEIEVVANAAVLERFKVEALNILSNSKSLLAENKKLAFEIFFGPGSDYDQLHKKYYDKDNGYVAIAQSQIKGGKDSEGQKLQGILNFNAYSSNKRLLAEDTDIFAEFDALKKPYLDNDQSKSFQEGTLNLYTKDFNANLDRTTIGLALSDPSDIGFLFALIGDKSNGGQITLKENSTKELNAYLKASGSLSKRILVISALGIFTLMSQPTVLVAAVTYVSLAPVSVPAICAIGIAYMVGIGGGIACFNHIRETVQNEHGLTKHELSSSATNNFAGTSGVSADDIWRYYIAPVLKEKHDYIKNNSTIIQKIFYDTRDNCLSNDKIINNSLSLKEKINEMGLKEVNSNVFLKKLNAGFSHVNYLKKQKSKLECDKESQQII